MSLGEAFPRVLDAARTGAEWAVTALYRDLSGPVLRYLTSQAPGEAEDFASEAWIEVARVLHRFSGDEQDFRRYVFAIAKRRLVDDRRQTHRRKAHADQAEVVILRVVGGRSTADVDQRTIDSMVSFLSAFARHPSRRPRLPAPSSLPRRVVALVTRTTATG